MTSFFCLRLELRHVYDEYTTTRIGNQWQSTILSLDEYDTIYIEILCIPFEQPCLNSSWDEICKWKRVDWTDIDRARAVLWWGHRRGEVESLSMEKPRHFTSRAQKSNASGDHEINNDNGSESFPKPYHWIRNSILHLMVRVRELLRV